MRKSKLPLVFAILHTAALGAAFLLGLLNSELGGSDLVRTILVVIDFPVLFLLMVIFEFIDVHAGLVPILLCALGALQWAFIGWVISTVLNRQEQKRRST